MNRSTFDTIKNLLCKYLQQELSPGEQQQLEAWLQESAENRRFFEQLSEGDNFEHALRQHVQSREKILSALYRQIPELENIDRLRKVKPPVTAHRDVLIRKRAWAIAASILLMLGTGIYYYISHPSPRTVPVVALKATDIMPGKTGAILTLADGSQMVLDSVTKQVIATGSGSKAVLRNGGLSYDTAVAATGRLEYNTITTPKGRQFQVELPDGTKAWLNAASAITYPTAFSGKERAVTVMGEVYFEVIKNAQIPFRVNVAGKEAIEVLGTNFNVNAYANETSINTTLLKGSVRITMSNAGRARADRGVVLKPGQQAETVGAEIKVTSNANIDKVMAWKNGQFDFEGAKLEQVMRQLERWYDIEVVYENGIPDVEFGGKITKGVSLNGLLVLLKRADVHFRQEGRKLIIMQ